MSSIPGYFGRILEVDLTAGDIRVGPLDPGLAAGHLGGRGLAVALLARTMDPTSDPLGPGNAVAIASSPLAGTEAPTAGAAFMAFKSPLTGTLGLANSGPSWGAAFKGAGLDALVIKGVSAEPVVLEISPEKVRLVPAGGLWGKTVGGTVAGLTGDALAEGPDGAWHILAIGPAGENLVLYATVAGDPEGSFGRGGPGAVWGSKKLKAVMVRGGQKAAVADPGRFKTGLDQGVYLLKQAPVTKRVLRDIGTTGLTGLMDLIGMLPHRNFQDVTHRAEDVERISGETLSRTILEEPASCLLCPIACLRKTRVVRGGREERGLGPEYDAAALLGPDCGLYDLEAITLANYRLNEYGLDAISFGGTLACAMELYERGILKSGDTGGLDFSFGRSALLEEAAGLVARREGFGARLADGSFRLAEACGRPEYSMTVKKLEIPAYDPRASYAQALGYMTSPTGACHLRGGYAVSLAFFGGAREVPRFSLLQAPITIRNMQNTGILQDSLGVCRFTGFALSDDLWSRMVRGVTGLDTDLGTVEDRTAALERLFNAAAGWRAGDDSLPARFADFPVIIGGSPRRVGREDQARLRRDYYRIRGWDENGVPSRECLDKLGLRSMGR